MPLSPEVLEYLKSIQPNEEFDKESQAGVDNARALRSATEGLANMTSMGELMTGVRGDKLDFSGLTKSAEESRAAKLANRERVSNYLKQKYDLTRQADKEDPMSAQNQAFQKAQGEIYAKLGLPNFGSGMTMDQSKGLETAAGHYIDMQKAKEAAKLAQMKDARDFMQQKELAAYRNKLEMEQNAPKAMAEAAKLEIPGFARSSPGGIDPAVAAKLRAKTIALDNFKRKAEAYNELIKKYGTEATGAHAADMESLYSELKTDYKTIKDLGQLTGPDLEIFSGAIPEAFGSGSYSVNPYRAENIRRSVDTTVKNMQSDLANELKNQGYTNQDQMAAQKELARRRAMAKGQ